MKHAVPNGKAHSISGKLNNEIKGRGRINQSGAEKMNPDVSRPSRKYGIDGKSLGKARNREEKNAGKQGPAANSGLICNGAKTKSSVRYRKDSNARNSRRLAWNAKRLPQLRIDAVQVSRAVKEGQEAAPDDKRRFDEEATRFTSDVRPSSALAAYRKAVRNRTPRGLL